MPFITSPSILQIKNAVGNVVVPVTRSIRFFGGIVVTDASNGQADVDGTGASGSPWDVVGNGGPGLKLGTNTADAWDMVVGGSTVAGFDALGKFYVSSPGALKNIVALDAVPNAGAGQAASIGSLGLVNLAGVASLWQKTGAADTDWTSISASAAGVSSLNGLTGAVTLVAGANVSITPGLGTLTIASTGGGGVSGAANCVAYFDGAAAFVGNDTAFQFNASKSLSFGVVTAGSFIMGSAALAFGFINTGGNILSGGGSLAFGLADQAMSLSAQNNSLSWGQTSASGGVLSNSVAGFAGGIGPIFVGGAASGAHGLELNVDGQATHAFGQGLSNEVFAAFAVGSYCEDITGLGNTWQATDKQFVVGVGQSSGTKADGFVVYKDKRVKTFGARINAIREVTASVSLTVADSTLLVDTSAAAGAVTVSFPAGEDGLTFTIKDSGANANVNNIVMSPDGADVFEAGADITSPGSTRVFQFFNGTWWIINLI